MWTITTGFRKFMRRLFLWLAVIFVVLAIVHVAVDAVFTWQLKSTISKLKTEGKLKPIEELIPPVPDSENAAPLYNKAFVLMTTGEGVKKYTGKQDYHFNNTVRFILEAGSDLNRWRKDQKENIPALVQTSRIQKLYRIIEDASQKPKFNPGLDKYHPYDDEVYTYGRLLDKSIELLFLKTKLETQAGNIEGAADSLLSIFRILNHIQNYQPIFSSSSVTLIYLQIAIEILKEIESTGKIREEKLVDILAMLSKFTDLSPLINYWKQDLMQYIEATEKSMKESYKSSRSYYGFNVYFEALLPDSYKQYIDWVGAKIVHLIILKAKLNIINKYDENLPYYKIASDVQKIKVNFFQKALIGWQAYMITEDKRNLMSYSAYQATAKTTLLGIALKIYKARHGSHPDSLHALTPEILDKIPTDPFTGKDFTYKRQGNGFLLYSIGPDMKDNRGMPRKMPYYTEDGSPTTGDIVWKSEM